MKRILILCFLNLTFGFVAFSADSTDVVIQNIFKQKDPDLRINEFYQYALMIQESNPDQNLNFSKKTLQFSIKNKDKISEALAYSQLSYHSFTTGDNSRSLEYSIKALRIAEIVGNKLLLAIVNNRLGHNYSLDREKQMQIYHSAFADALTTNNLIVQTITCTNIGHTYLNMKVLDSALFYLQRAEQISSKIKNNPIKGFMFSLTGTTHGKLKNSTLATAYFNLAIQEVMSYNSPRFLSGICTRIAEYYKNENKPDSCIKYAEIAIKSIENTPFRHEVETAAAMLMDIYSGKDNDLAMKYSYMYRNANDRSKNLNNLRKTQMMIFEEELHQQEAQAEQQKAEEQQKLNLQYSLIAVGILTFIILFILLSRSIIVTDKWVSFFGILGLLIVFEFINLLIHPFLEEITHHSPFLMLMALVALASLLIPLHHRLEKWIKEKMTEKNKKIRLENARKTIANLETNTKSEN